MAMAAGVVGLLLQGCGASSGGSAGDDAADGGGPRPLGAVTSSASIPCPSGGAGMILPPGTSCQQLHVVCPDVSDIDAIVAVTQPAAAPIGTVWAHQGGGGTAFLYPTASSVIDSFLAKGLRVVEVAWKGSAWELDSAHPSILAAACRPATVIQWAFSNAHPEGTSEGFCALGFSGGSAAVAYGLAHYGLGSVLDYAVLVQGPPFGRIDCGCDPNAAGCSDEHALCPELPDPPIVYGGSPSDKPGVVTGIDEWTGMTCGAPLASADADGLRLQSVVSAGADYSYPKTPLKAWDCATSANESAGLGAYYLALVQSTHTITCVTAGCTGEGVFSGALPSGTTVADQMAIDVSTGCVPRHP
jgi:hypothetical protein